MGICSSKSAQNAAQKYNKERLFSLLNSYQNNRLFKLSVIEGQTIEAYKVLLETYKQSYSGFVSQKQQEIEKVLSLLQKIIMIYSSNLSRQQNSNEFDWNQFSLILNKLMIDVYESLRDYKTNKNFAVKREKFHYSAKLIIKKYKVFDYYTEFNGPLQHLLNHMSLIYHTLSYYFEDKTTLQIKLDTQDDAVCLQEHNTLYNNLIQDMFKNDQLLS